MSKTIKTGEFMNSEFYQTHYYKASYEEIKKTYLELLKELNFSIISINDDFLEIYAEVPNMSVISKIIMQNPKETSIDLEIISDYLFGAVKKANKFIEKVYRKIEERYELKGLALHQVK